MTKIKGKTCIIHIIIIFSHHIPPPGAIEHQSDRLVATVHVPQIPTATGSLEVDSIAKERTVAYVLQNHAGHFIKTFCETGNIVAQSENPGLGSRLPYASHNQHAKLKFWLPYIVA
jgi:hypothetical protein